MRTIAVEEAFRLPQLATQVTPWSNSVLRADRLDASYAILEPLRTLAELPSHYVRKNVVITMSGVCSHAALLGAVLEIGVDHAMFAVDYPYESTADAVRFLRSAPFSETDLARISHRNAERVFRLGPRATPRA
ncbi:amidohydrolase family protein [Pseudonocardia alaniniphila]|uniref:Amidohydrolase family protein n=1 Tax=Pseudonocardia alaniniphila TaxID=75291 RepID=A0ABS9TAW3_9PSEU|nr:amidohydrolase family protein [Pseudonocardia alaniniphila]MCH6165671.1 amidohydrolase family protein [Pseudonocardia alaniniphila]